MGLRTSSGLCTPRVNTLATWEFAGLCAATHAGVSARKGYEGGGPGGGEVLEGLIQKPAVRVGGAHQTLEVVAQALAGHGDQQHAGIEALVRCDDVNGVCIPAGWVQTQIGIVVGQDQVHIGCRHVAVTAFAGDREGSQPSLR